MRVCVLVVCVALVVGLVSGFTQAFEPWKSSPFDPKSSKTFHHAPGNFALNYADGTALSGFICRDYVQLGEYYVETEFGCITNCNSPDFNGVDGIVGFGLPSPPAPGATHVPVPLLFELTDPKKMHIKTNHMLEDRMFAFLSTEKEGELHLGGFDPDSVQGSMFFTPTLTHQDFSVPVLSVQYAGVELLEFTTSNPGLQYVPGIIDSGSSCLVLPDSNLNGLLKTGAFSKWKQLRETHPKGAFNVSIAGHSVMIPWDIWFLQAGSHSKACVQQTPPMFPGVLIGDVLFREYLVLFDLRQPKMPVLGFAKQKANYKAVETPTVVLVNPPKPSPHAPPAKGKTSGKNVVKKVPMKKTQKLAPRHVNKIPIIDKEQTQYFINISLGTPRQNFTVTFDTGSSVFGVFSKAPPNYAGIAIFDDVGKGLVSYHPIGRTVGIIFASILIVSIAIYMVVRKADPSEDGDSRPLMSQHRV